MSFLRNAWYAAAWDDELTDKPLSRYILGEPVVLYRKEDGGVAALSDTCPHRFAPLHLGKVQGDVIACPYHGLQFGADGACVHNPHGGISSAMTIKAYPMALRYGIVWLWMGSAPADEAALPVIPEFERETLTWLHGRFEAGANYLLLTDNLMDLSHVEFMHPFLGVQGSAARAKYQSWMEGGVVHSNNSFDCEAPTQIFRLLWPGVPDQVAFTANMRWSAPANLVLDMNVVPAGQNLDEPVLNMPSVHILTPVNETRTAYFWAAAQNMIKDSPEFLSAMKAGTEMAFQQEDEPMVAAVQARMAEIDTAKMAPMLLRTDGGAVQARRALEKLIAAEA